MSESGDYTPSSQWQGHDFTAARAAFDTHAGRSYAVAQEKGLTASKLLPLSITTDSEYPAVIDTDFTGSMSGWDATIFSKFPYLDHELTTEYLGKGVEISFGAICDQEDTYPLQIRDFAEGANMKEKMEELVHAGGGSGPGNNCEAHGLAALYRSRNTNMPKALVKPVYIIITDEMGYNLVSVDTAKKLAKVTINQSMSIVEIFEELKEKYAVYLVIKPYGSEKLLGDKLPPTTQKVYDFWEKVVGADHIALLPNPDRVVDVIFGIFAKETGRIGYFRKELEQRQLPDKGGKEKVETVYKSLETIHKLPAPSGNPTDSKTKGLGGGKVAKSLI